MGMPEKSKKSEAQTAEKPTQPTKSAAKTCKKGKELSPLINLKATLNESIVKHLSTKYDIKQNYVLVDIKIFLGALAVILACIVTYISVSKDFNATYYQQLYLILAYFATNGLYEVLNRMYRIDKLILSGTTNSKDIKVYNEKNAADDYHLEYTIVTGNTTTKKMGTIYDYYDVNGNLLGDIIE